MTQPPRAGEPGERVPDRSRQHFPQISSRAYEHPADRAALTALRKLSGFDTLLKKLSGLIGERNLRLMLLANAVQVSERQFPRIDALLTDACGVLDVPDRPQLFVQQTPLVNGMTIGLDKPVIVLTTGLVDLLDEEELRFVVGHELGHAFSGHAVYRTMLIWLMNLSGAVAWLPGGQLGIQALITALLEWFRKAELSSDRAGLLVGQDIEAAVRTQMKMAGGAHLHEMNALAFIDQAREYESGGDIRDSILKLLLTRDQTHPFPSVRSLELTRWVESGTYNRILGGDYPRRDGDASASATDDAKAAADAYAESVKNSADPLMAKLRDFARDASGIGDRIGGAMYRRWGQRPGGEDPGRDADEDDTAQ
ncbi:M48 family metallopeptidase [Actinocrinis puniceicyclus]|uniref:M48 family metallopeptidase n=1 Tax=Actinocrinis puniceicyclus TaxID=977794 RepID=A0A8J7WKE6_9ACTN|nr:M48 family metallopeptidase [Actinocrinis puniceicyclus]MBS2963928.1 M48 family metallopeptidase [Actinocrinis puniceicyclus]